MTEVKAESWQKMGKDGVLCVILGVITHATRHVQSRTVIEPQNLTEYAELEGDP